MRTHFSVVMAIIMTCVSIAELRAKTKDPSSSNTVPSVLEMGVWAQRKDSQFWKQPQKYKHLSDLPEPLPLLDDRTKSLLDRAGGLLEMAVVAQPTGVSLLTYNDHFGHPVATKVGNTLIVVFTRMPQHAGRPDKPDQYSTDAAMVRSTDGGKSWSQPVDLHKTIKTPTVGCKVNYMRAIGSTADGVVIYVNHKGVFRSEDEGRSWRHLSGALGRDQITGPRLNIGPRIIEHPQRGLVVAGHNAQDERLARSKLNGPYIPPQLWFYYSQDGGRTWQQDVQFGPDFAMPIEPALLMIDSSLLVVARCHGPESYEPEKHTWRYLQMWSREGWLPMEAGLSTMRASDIRHLEFPEFRGPIRLHGPWTQDTVDLCHNPLTGRVECVATNRNGGGRGEEDDHNCHSLNLWSIDPDVLLAGGTQWRFEGTLIRVKGQVGYAEIDGMHPAAAAVDPQRGVQHIFIYSGYYKGPCSIFRVTRSLDSDKLREFLSGN